jgi:O-antigen biosynthesis protein
LELKVDNLSDPNKKQKSATADEATYDKLYYENYNGSAYGRTSEWIAFFDGISEHILETLSPKTVLDVGCAYGLLVETLRDRGVDAFGIDISDYAIGQSRPDLREFLSVHSILEPLQQRYDLIVSIEVVEHIEEKNSDLIIKNLCDASNQILLSTIPDDFDDPTHFNVQPPRYWIGKFAQYGFEPDITYNSDFLTPYAILFRKNFKTEQSNLYDLFGAKKLQDLYFSRVNHERNLQLTQIYNLQERLNQNKVIIESLESTLSKSQTHIENLQNSLLIETTARKFYQNQNNKIQSSWLWKLSLPSRVAAKIWRSLIPLFPRTLEKCDDKLFLECDADDLIGWGLFVVELQNADNIVFKLTASTEKKPERLVTLPVVDTGTERAWVFRNKREFRRFFAEISYGKPIEMQFIRISSVFALIKMIRYRWARGQGIKSGIRFLLKCLTHVAKGYPRRIFDELWPATSNTDHTYEMWLDQFDRFEVNERVEEWVNKFEYKPLISVILPTYNSDINFLTLAINSLECQSYKNWQLCIADDASSNEAVKKYLKTLKSNPRIDIMFRENNGHISAASNSAIGLARGEFLAFLDHDDQIHPHALACVVGELNKNPTHDLIYTDEDKINEWGYRSEPHFKSDWNPDLLLSQNYVCHFAIYRASILNEIGGLREGYEGAQDYDLLLRFTEKTNKIFHISLILYHWRAIQGSTALASTEKIYAHERAEKVLREAIQRRGIKATVMPSSIDVFHRIKYDIPEKNPLVSIIIPTRDRIELVKVCVDGIINNTSYKQWEILIIDNDSTEKESLEYFKTIESDQIKVLKFEGEFNYSAINNFGAKESKGDILLLLNNDIEVIDEGWLTELVSQSVRPEIGAVGARLYYADDHVQHDGIIVGIGGVAGYAHPRMARGSTGDFGGGRLIRNFSAVTAAALAVKKSVFQEVNGLDEVNLKVAFNDVDFCLRVAEAGYKNLFTPYCELYHHESLSRGPDVGSEKSLRFEKEVLYMQKKWSDVIFQDPYYNPNLSLRHGYSMDINRGRRWPWEAYD